jgi:type I restriction enzyme S subunit
MKLKIGDFLKRCKDAIDVSDGVKYKRATIRINHQGISVRDELDGALIKTKRQFTILKGQFLLSKIDARNGAFGIVPEELDKGIITGNFWTFDVDQSKVLIDFFKAFTETVSFTDICIRSSSGTTNRKYLDEKMFLDIDIEVPTIEEQALTIRNYHNRKEVISNLQNSGVNQKEMLAKLRQSILQEAVQGKLTAKWRANNPNTEPASELLKRIEAEKQLLVKEKKIKAEKPYPKISHEEAPKSIPDTWSYNYIRDISSVVTCGMASTPKYTEMGRIFLSAKNVKPFTFKPADHKFVSEETYQKIVKNSKPEKGDVLLTRVGAGIGEACVIDQDIDFAFYVSLTLIKPMDGINPYYMLYWLSSNDGIAKVLDNIYGKGVSQGNLNVNQVRQFIIPIPPLEEQKAIVEKVNALMALCDELEKQIETSHTQVEQLMQSCLKEVFEIA